MADTGQRKPNPFTVILRFFNPRQIAPVRKPRPQPKVPFESRQMRPSGRPEVAPGGSTKFAEQPDIRIIVGKRKQ